MSPHWSQIVVFLALVVVANGAPALLALFRGGRSRRLDGGLVLWDGRPALGPSKTWWGLAASLSLTPLAALAMGLSWHLGLVVSLGAMAGDLLTSFLKRRLGLLSSASVAMLDQIPESLLPGLFVCDTLGLGWLDLVIAVGAFTALDLALTPVGGWTGRGRRGQGGNSG